MAIRRFLSLSIHRFHSSHLPNDFLFFRIEFFYLCKSQQINNLDQKNQPFFHFSAGISVHVFFLFVCRKREMRQWQLQGCIHIWKIGEYYSPMWICMTKTEKRTTMTDLIFLPHRSFCVQQYFDFWTFNIDSNRKCLWIFTLVPDNAKLIIRMVVSFWFVIKIGGDAGKSL